MKSFLKGCRTAIITAAAVLLIIAIINFRWFFDYIADATANYSALVNSGTSEPDQATLIRHAERECKEYVQRFANDPDSVTVDAVTMPIPDENGEYFLGTRVRGNNLFGAKTMQIYIFTIMKRGRDDWTVLEANEAVKFVAKHFHHLTPAQKAALTRS